MTYDTVVVGAGVAGLVAALRLSEEGQSVLVLATGVGAVQLSSGTIDVLGYAPHAVESPRRALPEFVSAHAGHPYARVRVDTVGAAIEWFEERLGALGYRGGLDANLLLPTAAGVAKPSAVAPDGIAAGDLRAGGRLAIVGFRQLKDFYPAYVADNLGRRRAASDATMEARAIELAPPTGGEQDVPPLSFARRFDHREFRDAVVRELRPRLEPGERVGFPAVLGLEEPRTAARELEDALGARVFEIPTLPPSVPGIRLFRALKGALRSAGGRLVIGSTVVTATAGNGQVEAIAAEAAARPTAHRARNFVLASGGFAAGGLRMDSRWRVFEPIFGLPVAGVPPLTELRFGIDYFGSHPLNRAGIAVDDHLRPLDESGAVVHDNLHVAGAMLAGAEPWREKSGDGLSLATGYRAAQAILEREG